ncbi:MAG: hypothetical protein BGO49_30295 [Planctomycetales bacterium 71-10]|nr:MAG: hypothetical protein BGO49_30295 [Planctomycetales bacterium 71-10]
MPTPRETVDRRRLVVSSAATLAIMVLALFVPAGTWAWPRGWLFLGVMLASTVAAGLYLRKANPDVIAARTNRHEGTKRWDLWMVSALLALMTAILPVAALDDARFHWSLVPWGVCAAGYVAALAGLAGTFWAEAVNRFFEPTVRIQADRGQVVVDSGPYAIVRHPGYAFAFLLVLGMPLALGSYWALVPAAACCIVLVARTVLEDRTLQAELPGYAEYARRVRHRLIPGVW